MRCDPGRRETARARLLAMTTGSFAPEAVARRTGARRAALPEPARARLAALPDARLRLAADADALDRLTRLAAAIELAGDIAAVIDAEGRATLGRVLDPETRATALAARALAGPRRCRTVGALVDALDAEDALARAHWCGLFPGGLVFPGDRVPGSPPLLPTARLERLDRILAHAEAQILPPSGAAEEIAA